MKKKNKKIKDTIKTLSEQEEKVLDEILELYNMSNRTEDDKKFILDLITDWFAGKKNFNVEIKITTEMGKQIEKIKEMYDWKKLSPWLYSTAFESMLEAGDRRSYGAHYTSRDNIHKVIDPLFLDDLTERVNKVIEEKNYKEAQKLQDEIASLTFLDPACGNGNFLVETYISLRKLENKILKLLNDRNSEWMSLFNHLAGIKVKS